MSDIICTDRTCLVCEYTKKNDEKVELLTQEELQIARQAKYEKANAKDNHPVIDAFINHLGREFERKTRNNSRRSDKITATFSPFDHFINNSIALLLKCKEEDNGMRNCPYSICKFALNYSKTFNLHTPVTGRASVDGSVRKKGTIGLKKKTFYIQGVNRAFSESLMAEKVRLVKAPDGTMMINYFERRRNSLDEFSAVRDIYVDSKIFTIDVVLPEYQNRLMGLFE